MQRGDELLSDSPEVELVAVTGTPISAEKERKKQDKLAEIEHLKSKWFGRRKLRKAIDEYMALVEHNLTSSELAIASARTCYSGKGIVLPEDVFSDERQSAISHSVLDSTRKAGHLTTRQHANFVFSLDKVSRQAIWSFLHSHPFYNSGQVSQRYVKVRKGNFTTPALDGKAMEIYLNAIDSQMESYYNLIELLTPNVREEYYNIFPGRRNLKDHTNKYESIIKKKTMEVARYVLPVATHAYMYHTIGALTLMRYHRICEHYDVPYEQKLLVQEMVDKVKETDSLFETELKDPVRLEDTLEYQMFEKFKKDSSNLETREFLDEFDHKLEGRVSKLVDYSINGEATMADSIRAVLGIPRDRLTDYEAIDLVLNPMKNKQLGDTLNLSTLSKLSRVMFHVNYTFMKKLSHTADSQDQRHRMAPGSRPILMAHYSGEPDYITPPIIRENQEASDCYLHSLFSTFKSVNALLDMGVKEEHALYLLPNAFPIRFYESMDLLNKHHKAKMRLCYNSQEEIWQAELDEILQVKEVHPNIGDSLLPPCTTRYLAEEKPFCPEGDRFCGVKVWDLGLDSYRRLI